MSRSEWRGGFDRTCVWTREPFGDVGLLTYSNVTRPVIKNTVTVIGDGVRWLQLAPRSGGWFMTAMFEGSELTQCYFDIVDEIFFSGEASFTDLFLDVLFIPGKPPLILDADELSAALAEKVITQGQYDKAHRIAAELAADLPLRFPELESFCRKYMKELSGV